MAEDAFTSGQATRLAGMSYRSLDHWVRTGALEPSLEAADGSGSRRLWSARDLANLAAVAQVMRDMEELGMVPTHALVRALWDALGRTAHVVLRSGSISVSVGRPVVRDASQLSLFAGR